MRVFALALFFLSLQVFAADTIRIQLHVQPDTLNPLQVSDVAGYSILSNVVEGLVRTDGAGRLQNGLAESYSMSKDGKTYTFRLRKDARWSDGKAVTAEECARGLRTALDPKVAARDAGLLASIRGARSYRAGKSAADSLGIKVVKNSLLIELERRDPSFLFALTMPLAAPLRADSATKYEGKWGPHIPVTGKFKVSRYLPEKELELVPNPANSVPGQAKIIYRLVREDVTALNLFETGGLDVVYTVPHTEIPRLKKQGVLVLSPSAATFFLVFNVSKPPFKKISVRRSVAGALDRQRLASVLPDIFVPAASYLPRALGDFGVFVPERMGNNVDPEQKGLKFSITYAANPTTSLLMQRIQADLSKKLGAEVALEPMEWKAFLARLEGGAPMVYYMGYSAPFDDPFSHLRIFLPGDPDNHSSYASSAYARLVEKIASTPPGAKRHEMVRKAHRLLVRDDLVVVPLLERQQVNVVAKGVSGFALNPYGILQLHLLRKQ